jgi:hypothetical protein
MVIVLGEAMGFVSDVLQQPQGERMTTQPYRFTGARQIDLFLLFRQ